MSRILTIACQPLLLLAASAAFAQLPSLPGGSGAGGLGRVLGGGLPNVGSLGVGSATGILGYCLKNKLLREKDSLAQGVFGKLGSKPAVQSSPDFLDGQKGMIPNATGGKLSLDSLPAGIKAKACDMVLSKAQSFL